MNALIRKVLVVTGIFALAVAEVQAEDMLGGVRLKQTRVVMNDGAKAGQFEIFNHEDVPTLVAAWMTEEDGSNNRDFILTPGVFQLPPQTGGSAKILRINQLPNDRESVFYLAVKTMPAEVANNVTNQSQLYASLTQRIKVFYRPKGLKGDQKYAADRLMWKKTAGGWTVENTTPFSVSMTNVYTSGKSKETVNTVILPFSKVLLQNEAGKALTQDVAHFDYVNEWGGVVQVSVGKKNAQN